MSLAETDAPTSTLQTIIFMKKNVTIPELRDKIGNITSEHEGKSCLHFIDWIHSILTTGPPAK